MVVRFSLAEFKLVSQAGAMVVLILIMLACTPESPLTLDGLQLQRPTIREKVQ